MSISKRRERIKELILETEINTQGELARLLTLEGFSVTQATVSRDIKELGLIKEKGKILNYRYAMPQNTVNVNGVVSEDKVISLLKTFIVSVQSARNIVVVKTLEGHAQACGMAFDKLKLVGVLGSVAGDDTLMVVAETDELATNIKNSIKGYVGL